VCVSYEWSLVVHSIQGRIQDFQLGGGALKKNAPSGGRRENIWGVSCEKSRFFPIAEGGAKIVGVFRVKNHDFTPKNLIFSNFRGGGGRRVHPPPGIAKIPHPIYYNPMSSPPQKSHLCQTEMISRVVFVQNLEYPFCNLHLIFALCS
jgi:hypothetical protein